MKTTIAIICSTLDEAGLNIYDHLKEDFSHSKYSYDNHVILHKEFLHVNAYLVLVKVAPVHTEHIDKELAQIIGNVDSIIFCTKHASKSGIPTLTVHTQGNWSSADLGGKEKEVAVSAVVLKNKLYQHLIKNNTAGFDVVQEATHHGPSLEVPSTFMEIGSTHHEWVRKDLGQIIAKTVVETLDVYKNEESQLPVIFGIGGNHTCANYNRLSAANKALIGHIIPNYQIDFIDEHVIKHAHMRHTLPAQVILDWKSLKGHEREKILSCLEKIGVSYRKLDDLKKELD